METLTACYQCITSGLTCNKQREGCPLAPQYAKLNSQIMFEGVGARERADAYWQEIVRSHNEQRKEFEYQTFLHDLADLGVIP